METIEAFAVISGIISLITLIVFFVMSANVATIRKLLEQKFQPINYWTPFHMGELKEFQNKKQEALDYYMEAYFSLNKFIQKNSKDTSAKQHQEKIKAKIESLGGTVKELNA